MKSATPGSETLDQPLEHFARVLSRAQEIVLDRYANLDRPIHPGHSQEEVASWFSEPLPELGMDAFVLLEEVRKKIVDTATLNIGPNMYSYVMAGGNQLSIAGDMITSALNQNVTLWHLAPAMTEMEKRVIQWAAEFTRYSRTPPDIDGAAAVGGAIVSSGSAANLTGLNVARNIFFEKAGIREKGLFGQSPFVVYTSTETHGSIDKSVDVLGIGTDNLRRIPVDSDFKIDLPLLLAAIEEDRAEGKIPFCIVGNAGTVNTGTIDPLNELADICEAAGMWFHIDGAYGGLAASVAELSPAYVGLSRADSVALDFHKWLYQPFEIGCLLVRDWSQMRRTFFRSASYLDAAEPDDHRFDINEHHFQLSRSGKALKVWMSFKAFGAKKLSRLIQKDIQMRAYLDECLSASPLFQLTSSGPLGVLTFRFTGQSEHSDDEIDRLNQEIVPALERDRRVFLTGTVQTNRPVLRACIINHRTTTADIDHLVAVLTEVSLLVEAAKRGT